MDVPLAFARVALGCGVAAFALHNLTEFGLFAPGPAGVFWLACGALLAQAGGTSRDVRTPLLTLAAIATVIGVIVAGVVLWYPVAQKTAFADAMAGQLSRGLSGDAADAAAKAADADKLDPSTAANAARLTIAKNPAEAHRWALEAVRRNPHSYANWRLAADTGLFLAWPDAYIYGWRFGSADIDEQINSVQDAIDKHGRTSPLLARLAGLEFSAGNYATAADLLTEARVIDARAKEARSPTLAVELGNALWRSGDHEKARQQWREARSLAGDNHPYLADMSRAVELNPNDIRLRIDYAKMLCFAGQSGECLNQIDIAIWIDSQLMKPSIQELTAAELTEIETLKARARSLMETATTNRS